MRLVRSQDETHTRQRDCADRRLAAHRQRDVYGPVVASLTIFARAVERIDDPDALPIESRPVALAFFGEQSVVGPCLRQRLDQIMVGDPVAFRAHRLAREPAIGAHLHQDATGFLRQFRRQSSIGGQIMRDGMRVGIAHRSGLQIPTTCSTMMSAACSGVNFVVSMRISGFSGAS